MQSEGSEKLGGIEQRDDYDSPEVVEHRDRGEQELEPDGTRSLKSARMASANAISVAAGITTPAMASALPRLNAA